MRSVLRMVVLAMLYLAGVVHGQTKQEGGLAISLARIMPVSPKPLFQVEFRNVGEQPLTLTLGWGLGNGTRYADAVELLLVDRSPLQLKEFGFVAGMVYVWHVPSPHRRSGRGGSFLTRWSFELRSDRASLAG